MAASTRTPAILGPQMSDRAKKTLDIVEKFVNEECIPADAVWSAQIAEARTEEGRWCHPPIIEDLKIKAKKLGLWNMFLAKGHYSEGAGFTNLEYGLMCEQFGRSKTASEVCTPSPCLVITSTYHLRRPTTPPPTLATWKS
jgi:acyl-CoA dehydrogenase